MFIAGGDTVPGRIPFFALLGVFSVALRASNIVSEIPFTARDGLLWIEVRSPASNRPLSFVLDSGASRSVLDLATAKALALRLSAPIKVQGVGAEIFGFWPVSLDASANGVRLPSNYVGLDLSALSGKCSAPVDGLIGLDFFRNRIVQIDFTERVVRVLKKAPGGGETVAFEARACGFRIPASVNGRPKQWFRLDTGCVSPLQWVAPDVDPKDCQGHRVAVGLSPISLAETQTTLRFGTQRFDKIETGIHSKPIFPGESGLIGLGLLSQYQQITVDARKQRLILQR